MTSTANPGGPNGESGRRASPPPPDTHARPRQRAGESARRPGAVLSERREAALPNNGVCAMSLSEQLAAVLEHNGIASPSEAFPLFDLDQDERISAADLLESCTEVQIKTSLEQVAAWIAHHAQQEDKSFLTLGAWCAALQNADGQHVLQVRRRFWAALPPTCGPRIAYPCALSHAR